MLIVYIKGILTVAWYLPSRIFGLIIADIIVYLLTTLYVMFQTDNDIITISPSNPESRWVTLDQDNNIISEGKTPGDAIELAKETGKAFTVMFVPLEGNTYIF